VTRRVPTYWGSMVALEAWRWWCDIAVELGDLLALSRRHSRGIKEAQLLQMMDDVLAMQQPTIPNGTRTQGRVVNCIAKGIDE